MRSDASLMPPIRQTASIFKQPVTVHKTQKLSTVKVDFKHGHQEKPKQLFWEKRLEGLRACDPSGIALDALELPKGVEPVGPNIHTDTVLQSVATALHVNGQPITGQTMPRPNLETNPGVFINPDQPLIQAVNVRDDDIRTQEERVLVARKKLEDALKAYDIS
ncbi:Methyl-CpG-binding domain protein 2 [Orchesella cincta]|uniref:Methyl-CpG-binding domain protein 2 n=1 Tax=Orchesella cincta TaxID=48709 RepID=A0A1D2N2B9_ORCCI|nr:Methyl-CpG-binding domain protein 2 [Orchesella cincta]